jgi:hypothetical protein
VFSGILYTLRVFRGRGALLEVWNGRPADAKFGAMPRVNKMSNDSLRVMGPLDKLFEACIYPYFF